MVASGDGVEDDARVAHQRFHGPLLGVEETHKAVAVLDERFEVGEGGVDLFPTPVNPHGKGLLPYLERAARLRIERGEDAVERDRRFDLAVRQLASIAQI